MRSRSNAPPFSKYPPSLTTTATANFSALAAVSVRRYGQLVSQSSFTVEAPVIYGYDALGRLTSVTDPRTGLATEMVYNAAGQQASVTRPGGLTTTDHYYPADHPSAGQLHWKLCCQGSYVARIIIGKLLAPRRVLPV